MATKKNSRSTKRGMINLEHEMDWFQRARLVTSVAHDLSMAQTYISPNFADDPEFLYIMAALEESKTIGSLESLASEELIKEHPGDHDIERFARLRLSAYFVQLGVSLAEYRTKQKPNKASEAA